VLIHSYIGTVERVLIHSYIGTVERVLRTVLINWNEH